jgi:hypothetical protein
LWRTARYQSASGWPGRQRLCRIMRIELGVVMTRKAHPDERFSLIEV